MARLWSLQKAAEWIGCMSRQNAGLGTAQSRVAMMTGTGVTSLQTPQLCSRAERYMLNHGLSLPELPTSFPARYYEVFSHFPSGWHLQAFLAAHFRGREPSPASRELAMLMGPGGLTDLVLTVNFCDEIPDAVRERHLDPLVLDHPDEIRQRFSLSRPEIQILKLHGDYRHFDSCNLAAELKRRSQRLRDIVLEILFERSIIVLGYSGWAGDAFLPALRYHLTRRTTIPGVVWWFCYSDDDYRRLPGWLTRSPYVRTVTPAASHRTLLDAREVLSSLGREAGRVQLCGLGGVGKSSGLTWKRLRTVEDSDRILCDAYYEALDSNFTLALSLSQERQRRLEAPAAIRIGDSSRKLHYLDARYSEGYCLRQMGQPEEALARFRSVAEQASFNDLLFRGRYTHARNGEGVALADLGRHEEALWVWTYTLELPPVSDDPLVRQAQDFALHNLWLMQFRLGRHEADDTFVTLVRQLSASKDPLVLTVLGRAVKIRLAGPRSTEEGYRTPTHDNVKRHDRAGVPAVRSKRQDTTTAQAWEGLTGQRSTTLQSYRFTDREGRFRYPAQPAAA